MLDYGIDSMTLKLLMDSESNRKISILSDFIKSAVLFYKSVESN